MEILDRHVELGDGNGIMLNIGHVNIIFFEAFDCEILIKKWFMRKRYSRQ